MSAVTLLNEEQIFGENKLEIFNKITCKAKITDFSILLGGCEYDGLGYYWTKSADVYGVLSIDIHGYKYCDDVDYRDSGIRPVVSFARIKNNISNELINKDGIKEVEYGEYPQYAVNEKEQEKLEELYQNNKLTKTGKTYITDSKKYDEYDKEFFPQEHIEYEYDNKKYVRIKTTSDFNNDYFASSNNKNYVWVEVSKVKWLVDEQNDIALAKEIIVAGIRFDNNKEYNGDFENTEIYTFLNKYFIKDINISKVLENYEESKIKTKDVLDRSYIKKL